MNASIWQWAKAEASAGVADWYDIDIVVVEYDTLRSQLCNCEYRVHAEAVATILNLLSKNFVQVQANIRELAS
jgi:hypothetical protein